jgi:hypothetical protein
MVTYESESKKFVDNWKKRSDAFFKRFKSEKEKNKLTTTTDINNLWNEKYKKTYDLMTKKMKDESLRIWKLFH